jgi:DNA-binding MurR/RpiR family transcriptional regulator
MFLGWIAGVNDPEEQWLCIICSEMRMVDRLAAAAGSLTRAEERAAQLIEKDAPKVAFGSLAEVAASAGTSGPSVLRMATKLGFSGFSELKDAVQEELSVRLAPASDRVGAHQAHDLPGRILAADTENVARSLDSTGPSLNRVVALLADERRRIRVLPGAALRPVAIALVDQLSQLRDGVTLHYGPPTEVARELAEAMASDVVIVMDTRRYERWVIEAVAQARVAGAKIVAVTDTPLSPLVSGSDVHLLVRVVGAGPFDSLTGALSVVNALAAGVAARAHIRAGKRLRKAEEALLTAGALMDVAGSLEEGG